MPELTPLPLHAANYATSPVGVYVHRGRAYLEGQVYYGGGGDPGGVIVPAGGLPLGARPAADTPVDVHPDTPNSDSLYGHFAVLAGVIGADGSITVSEGQAPALLPSETLVDLSVVLGGISWVLAPQPDSVAQEPLDPWLFETINQPEALPTATSEGAVIGAHEGRVHLGGAVTMVTEYGNLIGVPLPEKYRPVRGDKLTIVAGDEWWPATADSGAVAFNQMSSRPLLRALSMPGLPLYAGLGVGASELVADSSVSASPVELYLGEAPGPEPPLYLGGDWTVPSAPVGTEFGLVLAYGDSGSQSTWYKVAAEKHADGFWWMVVGAYCQTTSPQLAVTTIRRLDPSAFPGELPNGQFLSIRVEETDPGAVKVITSAGGATSYTLLWPQDGPAPAVLPGDYGATPKWGVFFTPGQGLAFENVRGDYYIPIDSGFYPPTWVPDFGFVQPGEQFDLTGVGWRAADTEPEPDPPILANVRSGVVRISR